MNNDKQIAKTDELKAPTTFAFEVKSGVKAGRLRTVASPA
jgi:hypothetical protein